jgi:uncharacterized protein YbjT (DUF2867 family)
MKIVIIGASGLIGSRLRTALLARGHTVIGASRRRPPGIDGEWLALDVATARADDWHATAARRRCRRQRGRHLPRARRPAFRHAAPARRGDAVRGLRGSRVCAASCRSPRWVPTTRPTRRTTAARSAADDRLLALPLDATVVQPSLVFAADGTSTRLFLGWCTLPLLPLPAGGMQPLQPVHVDDAAQALATLAECRDGHWRGRRVALVGPHALTLSGYLQGLRTTLRLAPAPSVSVPAAMHGAARAAR